MSSVIEHAQKGKFVLGICNGFQVLTESGLLPGALIRNRDLHFICDRVPLKVERNDLPWTQAYAKDEVITLPVAHGEGQFFAVLGMMPHPERAADAMLGSTDGLGLFRGLLESVLVGV